MSDATEVAALQRLLAAEHAAIYGYGVLGARLDTLTRDVARQADDTHRARRDFLRMLLVQRLVEPVAAAAAYSLPFPVRSATDGLRLGVRLEEGVAATYDEALGATDDSGLRRFIVDALQDAAVRAVRLRLLLAPGSAATEPFPGRGTAGTTGG